MDSMPSANVEMTYCSAISQSLQSVANVPHMISQRHSRGKPDKPAVGVNTYLVAGISSDLTLCRRNQVDHTLTTVFWHRRNAEPADMVKPFHHYDRGTRRLARVALLIWDNVVTQILAGKDLRNHNMDYIVRHHQSSWRSYGARLKSIRVNCHGDSRQLMKLLARSLSHLREWRNPANLLAGILSVDLSAGVC